MIKIVIFIIFIFLIFIPLDVNAFNPSYLFTDQEKDTESGFYNFGAREYDPITGRFIQPDPLLVNPVSPNGEINPSLFAPGNEKQLQRLLKNPQRLNPYSYSRNNPINYIDPSGESEISAWLLNFNGTLQQVNFWLGVSNGYLKQQGWNIAAGFLEHSLKLRIGNNLNLNITKNNDNLNVINTIRQSDEYKAFIQDKLSEAEEQGLTEINYQGGIGTDNDKQTIVFNQGDLKYSLGKVTNVYINGQRGESGQWKVNVRLYDQYDFNLTDKYKDDIKAAVGANAAAISQSQGVISNYDINIQFQDRW